MLDTQLNGTRVLHAPFAGRRGTAADEEAAARDVLLSLVAAHRVAFSIWVYGWLERLNKGITTDLHDAFLLEGLASCWPSYTRRLLSLPGGRMLGVIDKDRLAVILRLFGMNARYALWDMKLVPWPAGVEAPVGPYAEDARQLADRLNTNASLHEDFYRFVQDDLFGRGGLTACAAMLAGKRLLAGAVLKNQIRNLRRQLQGERDIRGRFHPLTLPVLVGLCTYMTFSPARMAEKFEAWQARQTAKAA